MAVIFQRQISKNRSIVLWKINENVDMLFDQLQPDEADTQLLASYTRDTKKQEWLAGRLCAKQLAQSANIVYKGVSKDQYGKPFLRDSKAEISLSHSFPHVAAILDLTEPVGIDIEQYKEKLHRVAHKFLSDSELEHCAGNIVKLCLAWCAKETLYKIYSKKRLIFNEHMQLAPFELAQTGHMVGSIIVNEVIDKYKLAYQCFDDFALVYNTN